MTTQSETQPVVLPEVATQATEEIPPLRAAPPPGGVRLTGNVARVHHDSGPSGRLVYGGHTIGLALHQAVRALPEMLTVVGWHDCDHLAPVREGDTLTSTVTVERAEALATGGGLVHLRSRVMARRDGAEPTDVLDWRFVAALA